MNKEQFTKGITFLAIAYNKEFTDEQVGVWYEFFKDENYDDFRNAVKRIIPKKQFIPSIAELKQEITLLKNPVLQIDTDEAWDKALTTIRRYGRYRQREAMAAMPDEHTRDVIRQIGFERICNSENIEWERKLFKELFTNKKDNYEDALLLNEPQMTLAELTRVAKLKEEKRLLLEQEDQLLLEGIGE